jgi:hypothetical protein
MSPNDFSLSVHNTTSGLFSILSKNLQPSTAVAGGRRSLDAMFFEVFSNIASSPSSTVLAVIADMPCPKEFGNLRLNPCFALAMLMRASPESAENGMVRFEFEPEGISGEWEDTPNSPQSTAVEDFLRWAFGNVTENPFKSCESVWHISRTSSWLDKFFPISGVEKEHG